MVFAFGKLMLLINQNGKFSCEKKCLTFHHLNCVYCVHYFQKNEVGPSFLFIQYNNETVHYFNEQFISSQEIAE